jgi:large subunit ribosomal protein L4
MAAAKLPSAVFEVPIRPDLIHSVVVAQDAARRRGTVATKNRALVSGGGKPWRQKGTGRARHGSNRTVQWAGGGVVFGPQPRSWAQRVPKKVRAAALRSALSLRRSEERVSVVKDFGLKEPKTRLVAERLKKLGTEDALIVVKDRDTALERAARNLPRVRVLAVVGVNVRDVVAREHLVITQEALEALVERLS